MRLVFADHKPTPEDDWRHVVQFGRNVASYKFALAQSLIELADAERIEVGLEDLAEPFSRHLCDHLTREDRQTTSRSSRFLDACRAYNRNAISREALVGTTVRLGFENVIDAFHVRLGGGETETRFYLDRRSEGRGIVLTDALLEMRRAHSGLTFPDELDARWRLVETAWGLGMAVRVVGFEIGTDESADNLYAPRHLRRTPVTGVRAALSGYQAGRCAYCNELFPALDHTGGGRRPRPALRPAGARLA